MYKPLQNCWRKDLLITRIPKQGAVAECYLVKDPFSDENFEFGKEEYFLCQAMDGYSTPSEILEKFKSKFGVLLTEENFEQFSEQITSFNLLESFEAQKYSKKAVTGSANNPPYQTFSDTAKNQTRSLWNGAKLNKKLNHYLWSAYKPEKKFAAIAKILKPFSGIFGILAWSLIPGLPIALLTLTHYQNIFLDDFYTKIKSLPYLLFFFFNLTIVCLTAKLAQGIVFTWYGGKVKKFGLIVSAGFLPRFYIDREGMWQLPRQQQLWTFAIPLILRLVFFVLGVLVWYSTRTTGTQLSSYALLLAHTSFIDFLLDGSPLWPSDGYVWLISYFRLPPNLFQRSFLVWDMVFNRRPLPKYLSANQKLRLQLFLVVAVLFSVSVVLFIIVDIATRLAKNFHGIFGNGTQIIFLCVILALALRKPITNFLSVTSNSATSKRTFTENMITSAKKTPNLENNSNKSWQNNLIKIVTLANVGLLFALPYPHRPGGRIELTPPKQQQIQAEVAGKITQVLVKGGDSTWVKAGTVIAHMEATDINNEVLKTQEQIKNRQADMEKQKAVLSKLLATPKQEDVEVARQRMEVARQQVEVAKQQVQIARQEVKVATGQLQTAMSKVDFSSREASRFKYLWDQGAYSEQQYEDAERRATTERNNVEEMKQNLEKTKLKVEESQKDVEVKQQSLEEAKANLKLVMSGPYPQDIQAARKDIEATLAEIKRFQQELKFLKDQVKRSQLTMPFDGYVLTAHLQQKVGSYLNKGDTFAVIEDSRKVVGEIEVPEYEVSEIISGSQVEIKLSAYPNEPIVGRVLSIQPAAIANNSSGENYVNQDSGEIVEVTKKTSGQIVKVKVEIPKSERVLKTGMTGFAKIEGRTMPVAIAFTRPLIRFIQVEVWSWLP